MKDFEQYDRFDAITGTSIASFRPKTRSGLFFWLAGGIAGAAVTLKLLRKHKVSTFVGMPAPALLLLGILKRRKQNRYRGIGAVA